MTLTRTTIDGAGPTPALEAGLLRSSLQRAEDHPVLTVFCVALAVRLVAAAGMAVGVDGLVQPDEATYLDLAEAVSSGRGAASFSESWGPELLDTTGTFIWPLIALFELLSPSRILGQLLAATAGALCASVVVTFAGHVLPRRWAMLAGLLVALMPSQVFWSSLVLRESMVWLAVALIGLAFTRLQRWGDPRGTVLSLAVLGGGLLGLAHLRHQTVVIAAWATALAAILLLDRRRLGAVAAGALALLIPASAGLGLAGADLVEHVAGDAGRVRANLAAGADSSIIEEERVVTTTTTTRPRPSSEATTATTSTTSTTVAGEIVTSTGQVYEVEETAGASLSHAPKGTIASLLRPFPWEPATGIGARFAQLENLVWYLLYGLALLGAWSLRRSWRPLAFPVFFALGMTAVNAVLQGNLGTAFRHRGQIFWVVAVLAVAGVRVLVDRRRTGPASEERSAAAVA